ncbi:MAG: hypothetical protein NVS1B11_19880 [Terriglobales bacterium]
MLMAEITASFLIMLHKVVKFTTYNNVSKSSISRGVFILTALGEERNRGMWRSRLALFIAIVMCTARAIHAQELAAYKDGDTRRTEGRLNFQTIGPWSALTNLNADIALVYGVDPSISTRMDSWRQHGYRVQGMTGVAWGAYEDYLDGHFDGQSHWDEAQKYKDGHMALHGDTPAITPYISPGTSYDRYLFRTIQRVLDAGAEAITLEEPEYYADTGWSENFKREWKIYYGEAWRAPDSSSDAQYRASKLKYYLYRRTLEEICQAVRVYAKQHLRAIPCYVATHSLINYAHWTIVSPENSLIGTEADGYIAQVWTGTARTPNVYEGRRQQRTFTTAFLEFGAMQNLSRASGRPIWFLNDPVEDDSNHDWNDYRENWQRTLIASLLHPEVWRFEVAPWPDRIFNDKHSLRSLHDTQSTTKNRDTVRIPGSYGTEFQVVTSAMGNMKQSSVRWEYSGTQNTGVLVSDTMMFERADPIPSDENLGSFYGLALPPLAHGVPIEPVQIESATPASLDRYKLLLLTYEGQKPSTPEFHGMLAGWVRGGGALVVVDDDRDPYNLVREWWNTAPYAYQTPREHLFEILGIPKDIPGKYRVGSGVVVFERESPAALTYRKDGAEVILKLMRRAAAAIQLSWKETNGLVLRRGPYVIAAGLDESIRNAKAYSLRGRFIDLFDPALPILTSVRLTPGTHALLVDLDIASAGSAPTVLAAACRIRREVASANQFSFLADGVAHTQAVIRVRTARPATTVLVGGKLLAKTDYEMDQDTLRLRFPNSVTPVLVEIHFAP